MINELLKKELDKQQQLIIDDNNKYLCVNACPGAGKTYTLVKKIEYEFERLKDYQGIIACSFTKESSKEISQRLSENDKLNNSFIGTIDSFVMNIIIKPFINRYLFSRNMITSRIEIDNTKIDNDKDLNNIVRFYNTNYKYRKMANEYCSKWLEELKKGTYYISFPSYVLATKIIQMDDFKKYFSLRYPTIYIDEAQDMNFFQHQMLKSLKTNTNINIVLLGDHNQSIYQFRGSNANLFLDLSNQGYIFKEISVSVRCDPTILYYARKIFNPNEKKDFIESKVKIIDEINIDLLNSLSGGIFILSEYNNTAIELYEEYKNNFDIYYSKSLDGITNEYEDNKDIIDELIRYFLNYDNINDRYKYPLDDLITFLNAYSFKITKNKFKLRNQNFFDFMNNSLKNLGVDISEETINLIWEKLNDEKYKYYYYLSDKKNKIMTIHTSKGLENDNVIIVLESKYNINTDEYKNKLFVAITRARKNVFIYMKENFCGKDYIYNLIYD